jgi:hypothetical protein
LIYGKGTGNNPVALAVGAAGAILGSNGTDPAYIAAGATGTVLNGGTSPAFVAPPVSLPASSALGSGTTTSSTFGTLATTPAAVTITTGTKAMVIITGALVGSDYAYLGVAVSGATTIAASTAFSLNLDSGTTVGASIIIIYGSGGGSPGALTPGSNVFTAQLRNFFNSASVTASNVVLTVIPLN